MKPKKQSKNIPSVKRVIMGVVIGVLLLLDWAALDDITTGNEPNYSGEYFILIISVVIYAILIYFWFQRAKTN